MYKIWKYFEKGQSRVQLSLAWNSYNMLWYSLALSGVRYSKLLSLKCKQRLCGFPERNSSNESKALIFEIPPKKMHKLICEKTKFELLLHLFFIRQPHKFTLVRFSKHLSEHAIRLFSLLKICFECLHIW